MCMCMCFACRNVIAHENAFYTVCVCMFLVNISYSAPGSVHVLL